MSTTIRIAVYHNTNPGHSKQYEIIVSQDDNNSMIHSVEGRWGKIGYTSSGRKTYAEGVSRSQAFATFAEMERTRLDHGYRKMSDTSELRGSQVPPVTMGPSGRQKPKKLRPGSARQVESEDP